MVGPHGACCGDASCTATRNERSERDRANETQTRLSSLSAGTNGLQSGRVESQRPPHRQYIQVEEEEEVRPSEGVLGGLRRLHHFEERNAEEAIRTTGELPWPLPLPRCFSEQALGGCAIPLRRCMHHVLWLRTRRASQAAFEECEKKNLVVVLSRTACVRTETSVQQVEESLARHEQYRDAAHLRRIAAFQKVCLRG